MPVFKLDFNTPISRLWPHIEDYEGEVGIEVEVEGQNLVNNLPSYWRCERDGSLRGESMEYVLDKPIKRQMVLKLLKYLKTRLDKNFAKLDENSPRTSVHVHVNMAKHSLTQCYTYMILYMILEDILTGFAGQSRVSNLFCLRARDAEYFVDVLADCAKKQVFNLNPDQLRYTSVNACAIEKFNSIEFRALRGTVDPETIATWVDILLALKDASLKYKNPQEVMADFSRRGPDLFLKHVLPDHWKLLDVDNNTSRTLWDAARLIQEIVYATDWEPPVEVRPKRFFDMQPQKKQPMIEFLIDEDNNEDHDDEDAGEF